jgi:hypothetical protein
MVGYGRLQHLISRALFDTGWPTFPTPVPLGKAGLAPAEDPFDRDPFERSWMAERGQRPLRARHLAGPRLARLGAPYALADAVPEMVRRLRDDPAGWYKHNKLELPRRAAA